MSNSKLIAGAGEHYVAYVLSSLGYIAALVREGSPTVDLLASNVSGSKSIGIQVKTTEWALRTRGRGIGLLYCKLSAKNEYRFNPLSFGKTRPFPPQSSPN